MNIQQYEAKEREKWGDIWNIPAYLRRQYGRGKITKEEMERAIEESRTNPECYGADGYEHIRDYQDEAIKELKSE